MGKAFASVIPYGVFCVTAAAGYVLFSPRDAGASISRTHGAGFCRTEFGTETDDQGFNEITNASTTSTLELGCPMVHDSYLSVANITDFDVYGYDGNGSTSAIASLCAASWTGGVSGGECDEPVSSGFAFTGEYDLDFDSFPSGWASAPTAYWPYVHVTVPAKSGSVLSSVRGYRWVAP